MFGEGKKILVLPMCRVADYGCCCVLYITDQSLICSTLNCVPNFLAVVAAAQNMEANVWELKTLLNRISKKPEFVKLGGSWTIYFINE
jgi:hypothetical protein